MGDCQNYGPFLGPYYNTGPNTGPNLGDPKRDHNFDNPPCRSIRKIGLQGFRALGAGLVDEGPGTFKDEGFSKAAYGYTKAAGFRAMIKVVSV